VLGWTAFGVLTIGVIALWLGLSMRCRKCGRLWAQTTTGSEPDGEKGFYETKTVYDKGYVAGKLAVMQREVQMHYVRKWTLHHNRCSYCGFEWDTRSETVSKE